MVKSGIFFGAFLGVILVPKGDLNFKKNNIFGTRFLIFLLVFWIPLGVSWEACPCPLEFFLWGLGSKILEKLVDFEGFWKCNLLVLWRYWWLSWAYCVPLWPILFQDGLQNGLQKLSESDHKVVKKSLQKLVKKYTQKWAKMIKSLWTKIALTGFFVGVPEALGLCKNGYFPDVSKLCSNLFTMLKNGSKMTAKCLKIA